MLNCFVALSTSIPPKAVPIAGNPALNAVNPCATFALAGPPIPSMTRAPITVPIAVLSAVFFINFTSFLVMWETVYPAFAASAKCGAVSDG